MQKELADRLVAKPRTNDYGHRDILQRAPPTLAPS
jgi:16S rRNA A1518/A1519 N6-dimethyltransferase RsmA/KsgA/DIM1 with predicted DNA glycosylase/AP lyase activity